jgi:thiamine biosynthesis lipoprotein
VSKLFILCLLLLAGCSQPELVVIHGNTMGTTYSVKVVADDVDDVDEVALKAQIDARLVDINNLMSTYIPDSELSRFNRAPVGEWFAISDETMAVMQLAAEIATLSAGSFDVSVGPLVNLWGFGPNPGPDHVPAPEQIQAVLANIGFRHLSFKPGAMRRETDLYVDLSAIAKGYGVDQLAELLSAQGLAHYLVEIGGELRASGSNVRQEPWRIAVELPEASQRAPYKVIELQNMGMATSGDYRNYFEQDGVRYSHTIDPVDGYPIRHNTASVTVLAPTTARADALATAVNVMGAERGLALAEAQGLAVFVILKHPDGFEARHSSAFAPYLTPQN